MWLTLRGDVAVRDQETPDILVQRLAFIIAGTDHESALAGCVAAQIVSGDRGVTSDAAGDRGDAALLFEPIKGVADLDHEQPVQRRALIPGHAGGECW